MLFRPSYCSRILLPALALLVSGCGLSEYESKMFEQQQRLQRWDAENKHLGKPLDFKRPEKDPTPDVFLRAPKEIGTAAPEQLHNGWLAVYARQGAGSFQSVCINAVARAELENDLLSAFPHTSDVTSATRTTQSGLTLRELRWEDANGQSAYVIFLHPATKPTTGVVYQYVRGKNVQEQLGVSLETLAIGNDAAQQRSEFSRRGQRK